MKMTNEERREYLKACELCIKFIDSGDAGSVSWMDEDGYGFYGDIGYMYEVLQGMRDYLKRRLGEV